MPAKGTPKAASVEETVRVGRKEEKWDEHRWELDPASFEDYRDRYSLGGSAAVPFLTMGHQHR
jgi:hypothetical protein